MIVGSEWAEPPSGTTAGRSAELRRFARNSDSLPHPLEAQTVLRGRQTQRLTIWVATQIGHR